MLRYLNLIVAFIVILPSMSVLTNEVNTDYSVYAKDINSAFNQNITEVNSSACDYYFNQSGNNFNVESKDYYNSSGIRFSFIQNTISFLLKWNDNNSYSMSNINIIIEIDNIQSKLKLGIKNNSILYSVYNRHNITKVPMNYLIGFTLLNLNSTILLKLVNHTKENYYKLGSISSNSNINFIEITGYFYNFTIGNVTDVTSHYKTVNSNISNAKNTVIYKNIKLLNDSYPLFDNYSNTFLFISNNGYLTSYNVQTGNFTILNKIRGLYATSEVEDSTSMYFLINFTNKSTIVKINKYTYFVSLISTKILKPHFLFFARSIHVMGEDQYAQIINNNISKPTNILKGENVIGFTYVNVFSIGAIIYYIYIKSNVISLFYLVDNKLEMSVSYKNCSLYYSYNPITQSIQPNLWIDNVTLYLYNGLSQYSNYNQLVSGNFSVYVGHNLTYIYFNDSYLVLPFSISFISGDSNVLALVSDGNVYFYQTENSSNTNFLNITLKNMYVITESGYINVSVQSPVNYSINLSFCNYSLTQKNSSDFDLSLSGFKSGAFGFTLQVINLFGLYEFRTGVIVINNERPNIQFNTNISKGVYANEILNFSVNTFFNLTEIIIEFDGETFYYENNTINVLVPRLRNALLFELTIKVEEVYGINLTTNYDFEYYIQNITNFSVNLFNNEIINKNNINISIFSISQNVSFYEVNILNKSSGLNINTSINKSKCIDLLNGYYLITFYSIFSSGNELFLKAVNVTIISNLPKLTVCTLGKHFYSFYTNSQNNTFKEWVNSSISGSWNIKIYSPIGICKTLNFNGSTLLIELNKNNIKSNLSGFYFINITLNSINHYIVKLSHSFLINNTSPFSNRSINEYTNNSYFSLTQILSENLLNLRHYIIKRNSLYEINNSLNIGNFSGTFDYKIIFYNNADAFSTLDLNITLSALPPNVILFGTSNLVNNSFIKIGYNLLDKIPIQNVSFSSNSNVYVRRSSNYFYINVCNDGVESLKIIFTNLCGNKKTIYYNFTEICYPHFNSVNMDYNVVFNHLLVHLNIFGYSLYKLNITWYSGSKIIGIGKNLDLFLGSKLYYINCKISGYNQSETKNITIISIQPLYFYSISISFIILILAFKIPLRFQMDQLSKKLIERTETKLSEMKKTSKKLRFSNRTFNKTMEDLKKNNKVRLIKDLNGVEWVQKIESNE